MARNDRAQFHNEEASALRATAALAPGSPGSRECLAQARDHDALAQAARVGDYPHSSEHIVGNDI
ncbi:MULTISPECIES: hypothetical protein [unclassified Streptomyces]|uniref:hypothetical protein n=1 Tax=unclassified Streptomyces TaxID=2593676 RepID=UPI0022505B8D|nr:MULTISPECIES: hypothetical protein [unclassified Streptomyces]MCX5336900.1 hypothetical protein [Streptomyces sp. NBC_00140]MCX5338383.1 hypothetical protein [Streptomyces sp. NBC_00140]MCX5365917.1 hypothetical protein [Streptomyces sp. NBC_00124]